MIGQILEYNTVVTKAEFLFMIQSVNLPPSVHTITSSAHCSTLQPSAACSQPSSAHTITSSAHCSTLQLSAACSQPSSAHPVHAAAAITSSVHTAAMYSHVQLSAANLQCTLQPTAAIYNHLHCSYSIQCTLQLYHPVHTATIPSSAHCSYTIYTVYPVHLWTTTG